MSKERMVSPFSSNRLNGEPVPDDLQILLRQREELAEQTGIQLHEEKNWVPWLDTSYLSAAERANPDIAANIRAIEEVCGCIAFVAVDEEDQYFGFWRGPNNRPIVDSPLVLLDNEGQFNLCAGSTFTEAILATVDDEDQFLELRDWLRSLGIAIHCASPDELPYPEEETPPDTLHREFYDRHRGI